MKPQDVFEFHLMFLYQPLLRLCILFGPVHRESVVLQVQEPVLLLGKEKFAEVDIRVRVKGGGHVAQVYGGSNRPLVIRNAAY